jgi:hypothetical protein
MARNKKEQEETIISNSKHDELADVLAKSLNEKFKKEGKVAYFLDGSEDTPTDLTEWISTGSSLT